jgi:hypothetical protein
MGLIPSVGIICDRLQLYQILQAFSLTIWHPVMFSRFYTIYWQSAASSADWKQPMSAVSSKDTGFR